MTIAIIAVSVAYAVIGLAAARVLAGHLAWRFHRIDMEEYGRSFAGSGPSSDQWVGSMALGLVAGSIWPLALMAALLCSRMPVIGEEKAKIMEQQRKRIADLEREAGIR